MKNIDNNKTTIDDVLLFIREYGYKYNSDIQEELNKTRTISDYEISKEIEGNYELYKRMADM